MRKESLDSGSALKKKKKKKKKGLVSEADLSLIKVVMEFVLKNHVCMKTDSGIYYSTRAQSTLGARLDCQGLCLGNHIVFGLVTGGQAGVHERQHISA